MIDVVIHDVVIVYASRIPPRPGFNPRRQGTGREYQRLSGVMADSLRRVSTVSVLNQAVIAWILPFGLCLKILFHLFETGTFCLVKQIRLRSVIAMH